MTRIPTRIFVLSALALCFALAQTACRSAQSAYAHAQKSDRDTARAESLTRDAAKLIDANPTQAEKLLRDALAADLFHGPAHNNLGVLYLKQSKLYEAAGEFEWAKKLMPGHPDPRLNLALTLERAGRTNDALDAYASALDTAPEHLPTMQALARLQIRAHKTDDRTPRLLEEVALRGDPSWQRWAASNSPKLGGEHFLRNPGLS